MTEILYSFMTGAIVGIVFQYFKLPIPAPPVLAGVMGIFGIYAGVSVCKWFF